MRSVTQFVAVTSPIKQSAIVIVADLLDSGKRWGKPSKFKHSNQGRYNDSKTSPSIVITSNEQDAREIIQIIKFTGISSDYVVQRPNNNNPNETVFLRFLNTMEFRGKRSVARTLEQQNIIYRFKFTLNE